MSTASASTTPAAPADAGVASSSASVDVAALLREITMRGERARLEGDLLVFPASASPDGRELSFPRAMPTNFRRLFGQQDPYPLDVVWFLLEHRATDTVTYTNEAKVAGFSTVFLVDRTDITKYLTGASEVAVCMSAGPAGAGAAGAGGRLAGQADTGPAALKRRRHDESGMSVPSGAAFDYGDPHGLERVFVNRHNYLLSDSTGSFESVQQVLKSLDSQAKQSAAAAGSRHPSALAGAAGRTGSKAPGARPVAGGSSATASGAPGSGRSRSSGHPVARDLAGSGNWPADNTFIIVVPSGTSALLTLQNIKPFFTESKYIPHTAIPRSEIQRGSFKVERTLGPGVRPGAAGAAGPGNAPGAAGGRTVTFIFKDNPQPGDWDKVICVIANGKEWQWRTWPAGWNTPADIFNRSLGLYFNNAGTQLDDNLKRWNLKVLQVERPSGSGQQMSNPGSNLVPRFWELIDGALMRR
ncbi:hypothetical protein H696_02996 [Fonticula alba]|uniref:Cell division control protein 73 C-terminal domain-containing protein n=1 Tax=Fonticula alba TaxID=691883 RepID=A0A058Z8Q3_FONAL|nr:hypothetical protein H696_02996 [Fonticula alba]KCV70640.1 hypothetical protein H696_02996 [Fonticula alba]|eukprot:XP_009495156.1 hypothetical protein H696_02996 [Fonticula alba]